jgi:ribulose 1,5-bisphosphate synthetase/thiazole synthase
MTLLSSMAISTVDGEARRMGPVSGGEVPGGGVPTAKSVLHSELSYNK